MFGNHSNMHPFSKVAVCHHNGTAIPINANTDLLFSISIFHPWSCSNTVGCGITNLLNKNMLFDACLHSLVVFDL